MSQEKALEIIKEIKAKLDEVSKEIKKLSEPVKQEETTTTTLTEEQQNELDLENLKKLLSSPEWPEAVLDFQIVNIESEEEKMDRAEGVVDILIDEEITNKKFLDIGCGEGHMAKYASKEASKSVGYDIVKNQKSKFNWEVEEEKCLLTTDFEKVKQNGPYDIIMIYDVLDHAEKPEEVLENAKSVLSDGGKIYIRFHPWSGRHGGHYYRQINKAFVHLVFSEEELNDMGCKLEERNNKIVFPIGTYEKLVENSGLKKDKDAEIERQSVEDFFTNNKLVAEKIKKAIPNKDFPIFQMEQCFHDYILRK